MPKIIESSQSWLFIDPASGEINIIPKAGGWSYNGDPDNPTFNPSVREQKQAGVTHNHYFVRDGKCEYCSDCSHAHAGKTLEIPEFPEHRRQYYEDK